MNARQVNPPATQANDERRRRQRQRNWAIFLALAAFVIVVYIVTIVRMKGG
jgi:ferric-dicitrate binding protein FerR (iron transport regulator)